jgi:hypothetical protein
MMQNAEKILFGQPEKKRPLGTARHRQDNIKMDVKEIGCEDVDWIILAQDGDQTLVNTVMNLQVHKRQEFLG